MRLITSIRKPAARAIATALSRLGETRAELPFIGDQVRGDVERERDRADRAERQVHRPIHGVSS